MLRSRCGRYFTIGVSIYCLVMVFLFSRYHRETVTTFEVRENPAVAANKQPYWEKPPPIGGLPRLPPVQTSGDFDNKGGNIWKSFKDAKDIPRAPEVQPKQEVPNEPKPEPPIQPKDNARKLVILTYMRSGSSLTGDLLQHHPEVFYVYEPLWQTQHNYLDGKPTKYLDGTVVNDMDPKDYWTPQSISIKVLQKIGNCQFTALDYGSLMQPHMHSSLSTKPYARCRRLKSITQRGNDTSGIVHCLDMLTKPCDKANVRAFKVIRFTMAQLEKLMELDPNVKAIYLLRDPRGSLHSQSRVGEFPWSEVEKKSWVFCERVLKDLTLAKALTQKYPDKILTVRYEEIAEHPQEAAEFLYNFVGLQMHDRIRQYIWNITYAGRQPNCQICTTRTNATETAYKWRRKITFEDSSNIHKGCSQVFHIMGYRGFQSWEDLLNSNIPTKVDEFGDGYLTMKKSALLKLKEKAWKS